MNVQNTLVFILGLTILITAMLIIIVGFLGVLRVMMISVFDFDYVVSFKNWKTKKKAKEEKRFKKEVEKVHMGYYVRKD